MKSVHNALARSLKALVAFIDSRFISQSISTLARVHNLYYVHLLLTMMMFADAVDQGKQKLHSFLYTICFLPRSLESSSAHGIVASFRQRKRNEHCNSFGVVQAILKSNFTFHIFDLRSDEITR